MSAVARALTLLHRMDDDGAWRLLRADNAPFALALLAEHLGGEERRVDADELAEAIDSDLDELRSYGHELSLNARGYLTAWRTAGLIARRPSVPLPLIRALDGRISDHMIRIEEKLEEVSRAGIAVAQAARRMEERE